MHDGGRAMGMIPVIIDTDPGHDDAVAIMLAISSDTLDIRGITVVAGNSTLDNTTENALKLLTHLNSSVKVYKGAERPMLSVLKPSKSIHGESGLAGTILPEPKEMAEIINAVQFLEDEVKLSEEKITIIALGPLTNVATFILSAPELKHRISEIFIMGGAVFGGNRTPAAEFNVWQDPEAASIVFESGIPLVMCALDVTRKCGMLEKDMEMIRDAKGKACKLTSEIMEYFGKTAGNSEVVFHDAVAVARVLRPELFKSMSCNVVIDLDGRYTRGCTVTDTIGISGGRINAEVVLDADREGLSSFIAESLLKLDGEIGRESC
jgi:pyrimidine-specific ribonucleoside hydrolase